MLKYITAGMSFSISTIERVIGTHVIPAASWSWTVAYSPEAAIGLLTVVFGLYFGGKFSPDAKSNVENGRRDLQGEGK